MAASTALAIGCGEGIQKTELDKFASDLAIVRADISSHGGEGSAKSADLVKQVEDELSALQSKAAGRDKAVLKTYGPAIEAYSNFVRFKKLESETVSGMVLLRGANRPIAIRYSPPFEMRGGGRWVNRRAAMDFFRTRGDALLAAVQN